VKNVVDETAKTVMQERGVEIPYLVGTMIEVPRAALTADKIAEHAQFFSFGTNDLSQMTFGFSRDDAGKFLDEYYKKKIFESDLAASLIRKASASSSRWRWNSGRASARTSSWDLRRTWRRPVEHRVLPQCRAELRFLLAVPRTDRASCRRAGQDRRKEVKKL
jgi:hypothetical protein